MRQSTGNAVQPAGGHAHPDEPRQPARDVAAAASSAPSAGEPAHQHQADAARQSPVDVIDTCCQRVKYVQSQFFFY